MIYVKRGSGGIPDLSDKKTGYMYLLGVGNYNGQSITDDMKSVQEVLAEHNRIINLPVWKGTGTGAIIEGNGRVASGGYSHAEGTGTEAIGNQSHAEGYWTEANGGASHTEGYQTTASGFCSHAEGKDTSAIGRYSHAQGVYNYDDRSFIDTVGIGDYYNNETIRKNASVIYVGRDNNGYIDISAQKHGYQYLIDVGGYRGQEIGDAKSVQEVFADLENNKVDKVEGKSLVSDTDITKLSELPSNSDLNNRLDTKLDASAYVIDTELSATSPHPVQNKIVNSAITACIKKIDITTITDGEIDEMFE